MSQNSILTLSIRIGKLGKKTQQNIASIIELIILKELLWKPTEKLIRLKFGDTTLTFSNSQK